MVLLSLAELFFQFELELMARKMWETSVVAVASATPYFTFLRRHWFYLCILTTIIIIHTDTLDRTITFFFNGGRVNMDQNHFS